MCVPYSDLDGSQLFEAYIYLERESGDSWRVKYVEQVGRTNAT